MAVVTALRAADMYWSDSKLFLIPDLWCALVPVHSLVRMPHGKITRQRAHSLILKSFSFFLSCILSFPFTISLVFITAVIFLWFFFVFYNFLICLIHGNTLHFELAGTLFSTQTLQGLYQYHEHKPPLQNTPSLSHLVSSVFTHSSDFFTDTLSNTISFSNIYVSLLWLNNMFTYLLLLTLSLILTTNASTKLAPVITRKKRTDQTFCLSSEHSLESNSIRPIFSWCWATVKKCPAYQSWTALKESWLEMSYMSKKPMAPL